MHANHYLLQRLFTALDGHDHKAMAACYSTDAHFRDIAFDLTGRNQIHCMWHMICSGDIRASFDIVHADDRSGVVAVVDNYTFGASKDPPRAGNAIRNEIVSGFTFQDSLIIDQLDECDANAWARAAFGRGLKGFLAGHIRWIRSIGARQKLSAFAKKHPEYSE